jgi:hypothetical protein
MLSTMLQQPYVLAVAIAVLTATIVYFYSKTIEAEERCNKAFFKTLAAGLVVGIGLVYISQPRQEQLLTEPFMDATPGI